MTLRRLPSTKRSHLQIESLEDRCLLSGTPTQFGSSDAFVQYLISQAETRYANLFGQQFSSGNFVPGVTFEADVPAGATALSTQGGAGGNASFSQTNVQVPGVDEADIVKTDGNFVYYLDKQQLVIAQAWPASSLSIVSTTPLDDNPVGEYLNGSRLTVISEVFNYGYGADTKVDPVVRTPDGFPLIYPTFTKTEVTTYDVSNPASPTVISSTYMDGSYVSSREVGNTVYVVQQNYFTGLPAPAYTNFNGDTIYESQASYLARISGHELDLALPHFYTWSGGVLTPSGFLSDPAQIYQPLDSNDYDLTSVVAFDVTGTSPVATVSLFTSYASAVYASASNLYVAVPHWSSVAPGTSEIYQFSLNGSQVSLAASGSVPGYVNCQFSLDESGNYLRVVTTGYGILGSSSALYVLTPESGDLTVVGQLQFNIPVANWVRSVRFSGDQAFISTNNWNPATPSPILLVDVSNPTAPGLEGSITMPGFVSYFQPLDATHVLGIGRELDATTGGYDLEVMLFDYSNPSAPRIVDQYAIQPAGSWNWWWGTGSEAEWDAHALGYFPEYQTLAIPVYGSYAAPNWTGFESQLWVFHVDVNNGFTLLGTIQHDSQVHRSLRIGDQLYSLADDSIQVHPIQDPSAPGVEARITDDPRFPVYYPYYAGLGVAYSGPVLSFNVTNTQALSATISWGDGTTSAGTIERAGGTYTVVGNHTYGRAANYSPTVTFFRNGATVSTLTGTVDVTDLPTPVSQYVDHLYQDLLGRHADMTGLEYWGRKLKQGTLTRTQVATGVLGSAEYRTDQIDHLYASLLGRKADATGLKLFLAELGAGASLDDVRAVILGSPEYFQHAGGTTAAFLNSLYHDVLGRNVDLTGASFFATELKGSYTRAQVAEQVLASPEAKRDLLESCYQLAFQRDADASGLGTYTNALAHGISEDAVLASLFGSQEYMHRATA
jgi:uncharacterized secreted protein with C-terminal beta-propeller domain